MNVTIGVKGGERVSLTQVEAIIMERVKLDPKLFKIAGLLPLGILVASIPHHAFAAPEAVPAIGGAIKDKIIHSFDPLIDLIQALAFPIAGVMIAGGCLFIMVGNRERGMQMLQNAAIGYILVQLSPLMLDLLVGIGQSV